MTAREIDLLIEKFEAGNCTEEEALLFDQLLDVQASEMGDLYTSFLGSEKAVSTNENITQIVDIASGEIDEQLNVQKEEMGSLYNDYVAYAQNQKSNIDIDALLKLSSGELEKEIEVHGLGEAYETFIINERNVKSTIDVELLVQSHTGGLDALLEQQENGIQRTYTDFIESEKQLKSNIDVDSLIKEKLNKTTREEPKIIPLRKTIKRYVAVAAVFVAIISAVFLMKPTNSGNDGYASGLSDAETIEAEKALEQTLAALGMAKTNLDKGRENMKALKNLKHTRIFK